MINDIRVWLQVRLQGHTSLLVGLGEPRWCFSMRDLRVEEMKRQNPELKKMSLLRGREKRWECFHLGQ